MTTSKLQLTIDAIRTAENCLRKARFDLPEDTAISSHELGRLANSAHNLMRRLEGEKVRRDVAKAIQEGESE